VLPEPTVAASLFIDLAAQLDATAQRRRHE
jgi:hypothetical protein